MNFVKVFAGAALAAFVSVGAASAATCSIGTGGGAVGFTLTVSGAAECFAGNDTNTIDDAFEMFGMDMWVLASKNDSGTGDQAITFTDAPVNGDFSGTWGISDISAFDKVVVTLKAGNFFGAFLVTDTSGTWSATKDLSHSSIYYNGESAIIPLPAAGWLMLAGLGGIAALRRRK